MDLVSNLRKISGPAHLDFFFSVCHLDFFEVYGINLAFFSKWRPEKNPGLKQTLICQDLDFQTSRCRLKGQNCGQTQTTLIIAFQNQSCSGCSYYILTCNFNLRAFDIHSDAHQCTGVRFASFLSSGFITTIVVNPPERKLAKRTSVQSILKPESFTKCQLCLKLLTKIGI